jgi:ribosome biogenesis GTPase
MKDRLEDLGYGDFFEAGRQTAGFGDFLVARVVSESRGAYKVRNERGEYLAKITGKQMFNAASREDYPAVGDWVAIEETSEGVAVIRGIIPRATIFKRKIGDKNRFGEKDSVQVIATNIDVAFVVESVDRDFNLNRLERYFAIAEAGGVRPVVVLNKVDLISAEDLAKKTLEFEKRFPKVDVVLTSTLSGEGLSSLRGHLEAGKTYCFLGSSGVGKSSLINKLFNEDLIKTGEVSLYSDRGRHTTTSRQMYFLNSGAIVIDNPGIREVGMTDVSSGVESVFDEILVLAKKCKYSDCAHVNEPGCAVLRAVKSGKLNEQKYSNYLNLKKETGYYELNDFEKREKDRRFGKMVKKAKKQLITDHL